MVAPIPNNIYSIRFPDPSGTIPPGWYPANVSAWTEGRFRVLVELETPLDPTEGPAEIPAGEPPRLGLTIEPGLYSGATGRFQAHVARDGERVEVELHTGLVLP